MSENELPKPTDAELAILQVLWRQGPCTVRQVNEELAQSRAIGYTTVLKLMQIMAEKGLVVRNVSQRTHIYQAARSEQQTQRQLVSYLLDRAFGGSGTRLVMQALSSRPASSDELSQIRQLLDELEESAE